ncbi:hypothetical protein EDB85DRAFT_1930476, partial [Lactarius pseudohatsudake]
LSLLLLLWCASYGYCAPQVDFQVAQPPPLPQEVKQCTIPILQLLPCSVLAACALTSIGSKAHIWIFHWTSRSGPFHVRDPCRP